MDEVKKTSLAHIFEIQMTCNSIVTQPILICKFTTTNRQFLWGAFFSWHWFIHQYHTKLYHRIWNKKTERYDYSRSHRPSLYSL